MSRLFLAVLLLAASLPPDAEAARPGRSATLDLPSRPTSVAFDDVASVLVVGTRKSGAHPELYGIGFGEDGRTPQMLWSLELKARVHAVAVDGSRAYVATSHDRAELVVVDVASGEKLGAFDAPGNADAIAVDVVSSGVRLGRKLSSDRELFVLDTTDPGAIFAKKAVHRPKRARTPPAAVLEGYRHAGKMIGCASPEPGLHYVVVTDQAAEVQVAEDVPPVVFADVNGDGVYRLACLGDSNTAAMSSWCERLVEMIDDRAFDVVNVAVPGATVVSPNRHFDSDATMQLEQVLADDVDAVLLAFGTNDRIQGRTPARVVQAYLELDEVAAAAGLSYFLATTPPMSGCVGEGCTLIFATNALVRDAFPGRVVEFFDGFTVEHFSDNLHLNDLGQDMRAVRALEVLGNPVQRP